MIMSGKEMKLVWRMKDIKSHRDTEKVIISILVFAVMAAITGTLDFQSLGGM